MNATRELLQQLVFFASILAGFGISIAVQIISLGNPRRIAQGAIAALLVASLSMLSLTLLGSLLLFKFANYASPEQMPPDLLKLIQSVGLFCLYLLLSGLGSFMLGIGLVGWLHSKFIGLVSSVAALFALGIMLWAVFILFPA